MLAATVANKPGWASQRDRDDSRRYEPEPELRWDVRLWCADDALIEAMNAAIDQIIDKRTAYQIYAKYGLAYHLPFPASDGAER